MVPRHQNNIFAGHLVDSFAELQKVGVVVLAVLDRLVLRVEGLLGAVVRKSLAVVRQEGLRRVATGERLEKIQTRS